jgi:NADPH:quinone reductase-like Zn-dependent oxidoreductase
VKWQPYSAVVGVCSAANAQLATSQGATRCVDYNDQAAMDALVSEGRRYDVVGAVQLLNSVGP